MLKAAQPGNQTQNRRGIAARYLAFAVVLLLGAPLWAQSQILREGGAWVEETIGTLQPGRNVRIVADVGSVEIETGGKAYRYIIRKRSFAWTQSEARRQFDMMRIVAGRDGDYSQLRVAMSDAHHFGRLTADIILQLPRDLAVVKVDTAGGNIVVQNTSARLELVTKRRRHPRARRDITRSRRARWAEASISKTWEATLRRATAADRSPSATCADARRSPASGSNININSVGSGSVDIDGGCISVNHSGGDLVVKTTGGSVTLGSIDGNVTAETGGGNIRLGSARGLVTATAANGNIELWKLSRGARAQSSTGAITAEFLGGRGAFNDSLLRTTSGDVRVYLNNKVAATVHASSAMASGMGIQTDFKELRIVSEGSAFGPNSPRSMFAEGTLNGGGPQLKVLTTVGQIEFWRAK
jgi:hypothetical protein